MQKLGFYLLVFLILISLASASFISLTTQINVQGTLTNQTHVIVSITNNGDEAAEAIQPEIEFNNNKFIGETIGSLEPKASHTWSIPIKPSEEIIPGRYPVVLTTRYYDINNYAFSSISPSYITYKEETTPAVFGTITSLEMVDQGKLSTEIINLDDIQKKVMIRLYLPKELTTNNDTINIVMLPKSKKEYTFNIERFSALPKSNYAVAAILEYDENGKHYTNILRGSIKLIEEIPSIRSPVTIIIAIIIVIVFVGSIIFLEIKRRKKSNKDNGKNNQQTN